MRRPWFLVQMARFGACLNAIVPPRKKVLETLWPVRDLEIKRRLGPRTLVIRNGQLQWREKSVVYLRTTMAAGKDMTLIARKFGSTLCIDLIETDERRRPCINAQGSRHSER
jgi:hypothetical protein